LDLAKYRAIFVEDATENLGEISRALLELEKDPARTEAIDEIFRMAHSIKGMAASLDYASITEVAHRLEDRMQVHQSAGRVEGAEELSVLFRGLEGLEAMVGAVRETGEPPPPDPELAAALAAPLEPPSPAEDDSKKKALSRRLPSSCRHRPLPSASTREPSIAF
jgi:two-component system chemotaxis sensor kinase CheA